MNIFIAVLRENCL